MQSKLKQKHIQQFLQDVGDFDFGEKDRIGLEQHLTPPDVAAKLLFHIYQNEPIEEYVIADLGIGTGMLICGAVYIGALHSIGFEIDDKYIRVAEEQLNAKLEGGSFELVAADISHFKSRDKSVDLVMMNPPFGTKEAGIDMKFLDLALRMSRGNVYSMHKSSTRSFILQHCAQQGYRVQILFEVKFPLKKRFKGYHKKEVAFTEVDVILVSPKE